MVALAEPVADADREPGFEELPEADDVFDDDALAVALLVLFVLLADAVAVEL